MSVAKTEFAVLVDRAHADPNIVGLLLAGSRGRGAYITDESDYDTYVILGDGRWLDEYADRFPSAHGDAVEYILLLLESFRAHALPGSPSRWNAYTFAHIEPLVDKLDGEIGRIASAKTLPGPCWTSCSPPTTESGRSTSGCSGSSGTSRPAAPR